MHIGEYGEFFSLKALFREGDFNTRHLILENNNLEKIIEAFPKVLNNDDFDYAIICFIFNAKTIRELSVRGRSDTFSWKQRVPYVGILLGQGTCKKEDIWQVIEEEYEYFKKNIGRGLENE